MADDPFNRKRTLYQMGFYLSPIEHRHDDEAAGATMTRTTATSDSQRMEKTRYLS